VGKRKKLSIICPIYNEAQNIEVFYRRVKSVLDNLPYDQECVFINDGSKDNSLALLHALYCNDKSVKIINLSRNFGKEIALTAGIDLCTGDAVIPIDADLQDPPELIRTLVEKWEEGYDVVFATRTSRKAESILKKLSALLFYKILNFFSRTRIPKNTGDFRLMDRKVVDSLKELREVHRFMKGLFSWVGFKQTGITYVRDPRYAGKTKWNYFKLFNLAIEGITSFSDKPLKFASLIGVLISLGALGYGGYFLINTVLFGNPIPGYPSLVTIMLFLGGVQLLSLGIIGEYIGRTYMESKRRKLYFIRNLYGFQGKSRKQGKDKTREKLF
jgi:glycosyltransferase involved in cell wall biosynthesis